MITKRSCLLVCAVTFVTTGNMISQTKEEIKTQAISQLKKMTPDEVESKIREYGMTRSEAVQKAREMGVSIEDYIQSIDPQDLKKTTKETFSGSQDSLLSPEGEYVLAKKRKMPEKIPGFFGRPGIDSTILPFGYDIFQYPVSTFQPIVNVATSPSYVLGIGDEILVTVWGETKLSLQQIINKDGNIVVSDVGPVGAVGLTVQQLKEKLLRRMTAVYSSLKNGSNSATSFMDVSIGKVRTLQVFVLGEVEKPGGYSVSSLSTVMQALYLSGGPTINGSMREVQLRRDGKLYRTIDLYDYILKADNSKDARLQDGDIVFVKPYINRVAIVGNLFRPAIYDLKEKETLKDLLSMAGGLLFDSYFNTVHIERIIPFAKRTEFNKNILDIDLTFSAVDDLLKSSFGLQSGDIVLIRKISEEYQNRVSINGNVKKPGYYEFKKDLTVRDIIVQADSLKGITFSKGLIFRMLPNRKRQMLSFDPNLAMTNDPVHNLLLENEDSIRVYSQNEFFKTRMVTIGGQVRNPGIYPRNENLTVTDLIVLAGGLREEAAFNDIEISHVDTTNLSRYSTTEKINLSKEYWKLNGETPFYLRDLDYVFVPRNPLIGEIRTVAIFGMVKFPGYYTVQRVDERLSSIIARAGGPKEEAYLEAGEYYRASKSTGKIPLDMRRVVEDPKSPDNLIVNGGDSIYIGMKEDIVFVRGEVYVPSPVIYKPGASIDYYIKQAGGFTEEANEGGAVAFLPTGKKWEPGWWFFPNPEIMPGSTVFVPKKVEKPDTVFPYIRDIVMMLASVAAITVSVVSISKQ